LGSFEEVKDGLFFLWVFKETSPRPPGTPLLIKEKGRGNKVEAIASN
jgi:hypothetical protein